MDTATTRFLRAEARLAQLEDWRDMVRTRALELLVAGRNLLLLAVFIGSLHLIASFDERTS